MEAYSIKRTIQCDDGRGMNI